MKLTKEVPIEVVCMRHQWVSLEYDTYGGDIRVSPCPECLEETRENYLK